MADKKLVIPNVGVMWVLDVSRPTDPNKHKA